MKTMAASIATVGAAAAAVALIAAPASAATASRVTGTFVAGSGNYLIFPNGTDGLSKVGGHVTFTQWGAGKPIHVAGRLTGLRPGTRYVSVIYKDSKCLPVVGVTAFPSGTFVTDSTGAVTIPAGVTVNPRAINPAGAVNVPDTNSISVRRVVVSAQALPPLPGYPNGLPAGTPTVPNAAAVEGCRKNV